MTECCRSQETETEGVVGGVSHHRKASTPAQAHTCTHSDTGLWSQLCPLTPAGRQWVLEAACCWLHCQGWRWHEGCLHTTSPTHWPQCRGQPVLPHLSRRTAVGCIPCHSLLQECPCPSQVWAGSCVWSCQTPADATCSAPLRIARTKWKKIWEENKEVSPCQGLLP